MKRVIYSLVFACVLLFAFLFSFKPIILFITDRQLSHVFLNSDVKIGSCALKSLKQLRLLDIQIKKEPLYAFKAGQIDFNFVPSSILKGRILKIVLHDATANINFGNSSILEFNKHIKLGSGKAPFLIDYLELSNISLNLTSKEFNIKARLHSGIDLIKKKISQIDLGVDTLNGFGISLENASLEIAKPLSVGALNIAKVKYGKAVISQIKANARFDGSNLILDSLSAKFSNGEVEGSLSFKLDKTRECLADLEFINLDMDTFVKDFELGEKLKLSGKLTGYVKFKSTGQEIKVIDGNLRVNEPGGILTISDSQYLEKMARNSGKSLGILVESFKNYHYHKGGLLLSLEGDSLVFNANLEGETGKRNLAVVLHNFNVKE